MEQSTDTALSLSLSLSLSLRCEPAALLLHFHNAILVQATPFIIGKHSVEGHDAVDIALIPSRRIDLCLPNDCKSEWQDNRDSFGSEYAPVACQDDGGVRLRCVVNIPHREGSGQRAKPVEGAVQVHRVGVADIGVAHRTVPALRRLSLCAE